MLAIHHTSSCLVMHTTSPDVPPPTLRRHKTAYLKYHTARLTNARISLISFGYVPIDFSTMSKPHSQSYYGRTSPHSSAQHPQTSSYSLCDSPVGLLAYVLDALHTPSSTHTWTYTDILNWTMMYWLPGPEASLRWLWEAHREAAECWSSWSATPLGISTFRAAGDDGADVAASPPMWAAGVQNLTWMKRHERLARFPAWECPDELVLDLREFVKEMIESGHVRFKRMIDERSG